MSVEQRGGGSDVMGKNREDLLLPGHDKATVWALWAYWVVHQRRNADR
jgi:hypothetical protein